MIWDSCCHAKTLRKVSLKALEFPPELICQVETLAAGSLLVIRFIYIRASRNG